VPTLMSPLRHAVETGAQHTAARCGDLTVTYAEMWDRCGRLAGALRGLGLGDGDRVATVGPNCHRHLELYQSIPGSGLVIVPLNARHTSRELRYAIEDSGARVLFTALTGLGLEDAVEHVIDLDRGYEALLATATPYEFPEELPARTLAGLFYTGGTTGASKGVMLSHGNLLANAMHYSMSRRFDADMRWLICAPLFHAAGSIAVLSTIWGRGEQIVLPGFDPDVALDLIERHAITATIAVPSMLAALIETQLARPRDVATLRYLGHGGSPIASETLRRAHAVFPEAELVNLYGATETAPLVTVFHHEERAVGTPRDRSCGQPTPGVEVRVVDEAGRSLPRGDVGEISVRGANVMQGYWNKPAETAAALVDGWYRSGDVGYQDADGFVFIVDRAKDVIITGGENVYSTEVEDALYRHPAVLEAAVFAVPHERWGEAVHAVVVPRVDVEVDVVELTVHCRGLIADYKVPKFIEVREEPLPKSGAGKVLKRVLRDEHWSGDDHVGGA
jgi:long-chain acyl-CoA synthetase